MVSLADSLKSSTGRRLALRKRPDLQGEQHVYQGRAYWIVKEPLGLHYFRFQEEEYALLNLVDGRRSLDDIKSAFEAKFPPQKIRLEELGQFVGMLHRSGLVISDAPGQGHQLLERRKDRTRKEWINRLSNILSMRFRGINPERLLNWLYPKMRWFFTTWACACCLLFGLSALTLVLVNFDTFQAKLPTFHQFFTLGNAFSLMVVLAVTKVLHEFGHGLSCKHFGGECHEMGVMLLVLTPCLYCNVSDSWMLPNKWQRAAIGAAGMYVEIVIASICTYLWWFSQPGLLHHLCLSAMFVCSVSTVLFNGNPLMRYDGYYILSDLAEIPNLSQKSSAILSRTAGQVCLGIEPPEDPFLPRRHVFWFGFYAVAAAMYRWVVVFSILFFLNEFFKPYRLEVIGRIIGGMSLYGLLVQPVWRLAKFFYVPGRTELVKKPRMFASLAVLAAIIAAIVMVPLPHRVYAPLEIEPHQARSVYVDVAGELSGLAELAPRRAQSPGDKIAMRPGIQVEEGDPIAYLVNHDLALEVNDLRGQAKVLQTRIASTEQLRVVGDAAAREAAQDQMGALEDSLAALNKQLAEKERDLARLTLRAPATGTVLPPPESPKRPSAEGDLSSWSGNPFDPRNLGCHLEPGTLFCQVGDPNRLRARVLIDQADRNFVSEGQEAEIMLDEIPGVRFHGTIESISTSEVKVSPRHVSNKAGGELPTKTDEAGVERPISTTYEAHVLIGDAPPGLVRIGVRGEAKVHVRWEPLGSRLWRWFSRTFHFKL